MHLDPTTGTGTFPVEVIYAPLDEAEEWAGPGPLSPGAEALDEAGRAAERTAHLARLTDDNCNEDRIGWAVHSVRGKWNVD